ncbi:MAG: transglycosylase domain-containing protein [Phycisphaerales bacterium]|nr:transglycosylase domain-containing protein [Phycisphaerales bacterium]
MSKKIKILWGSFLLLILLFNLFIVLFKKGYLGPIPSIDEIENPTIDLASQIYADDGSLLGRYYLEDRVMIGYNDIGPNVINALVATEDRRFYDHSGIDVHAIIRAIFTLGKTGGGSTITMQTAKNMFTEHWDTKNVFFRLIQKFKEAIIALELERYLTKQEILVLYLNKVSFSDNIFGIQNAAKTFFNKLPNQLTVDESALLVGMLKANTLFNPRRNPVAALERRNVVIDLMVKAGYIDNRQANIFKAQPLGINYQKLDEKSGLAPYFRMIVGEDIKNWCKNHTKPDGSSYNLFKDGLKIYTTLNPYMQQYAEEAVEKHMAEMQTVFAEQPEIVNGAVWNGRDNFLQSYMYNSDRWRNMSDNGIPKADIKKSFFIKTKMRVFSWKNPQHVSDTILTPFDSIKYYHTLLQTGFLAVNPQTGEVKAWVGGIDFDEFKYDHVNVNTKRQVGSTIKPLLYSLAMEELNFNPSTIVMDSQQNFGTYGLVPATNKSCSNEAITIAKALAFSRNCATASVLKALDDGGNEGAKKFVDFLKKCGITTPINAYPSVALGSCDLSVYEMIQAYTMFPNVGCHTQLYYISKIEDRNGNVLFSNQNQKQQLLSTVTDYNIVRMMMGVVDSGTARRMWRYGVKGQIAGKTGTTNDNSDAWFIGYTPQILAGAWVGCDDRFIRFYDEDLGQGSALSLPTWAYFYLKASKDPRCGLDTNSYFIRPDFVPRPNYNPTPAGVNNFAPASQTPPQDNPSINNDGYDLYDMPSSNNNDDKKPKVIEIKKKVKTSPAINNKIKRSSVHPSKPKVNNNSIINKKKSKDKAKLRH